MTQNHTPEIAYRIVLEIICCEDDDAHVDQCGKGAEDSDTCLPGAYVFHLNRMITCDMREASVTLIHSSGLRACSVPV